MGRAMRWLKKLLSGKKEGHKDPKVNHATSAGEGVDAGEKKRWSFVKQRNSGVEGCKMPLAAAVDAAELSLVRPCGCGQDGDVRWRAGRREAEAAVVIQKSFRGYLARKALRALKALVKLQALVRGYLVRKQAATTLHRLQALMRLQAASYGIKKASSWRSMEQERIMAREGRIKPRALQGHRRRLSDSTDSNLERSPRIVEIDTCQLRSRSSRMTGQYAPEFSDGLPALAPWSSPLLYKSSSRLSNRRCQDRAAPRQSKTAQSTPRFAAPPGFPSYDSPAKSVGAVDGLMRRSPHYMAETASSVAKARCQSAPRLRHAALAGPRKSCSQVQHSSGFKSSEVYSSEFSDEPTRDYYLDSMW